MDAARKSGYRLMHHSRRIPFDIDSKSAKPYFEKIKAEYDILYPAAWPDNLYRYELTYYKNAFAAWIEESKKRHIKSRHLERVKTMEQIYGNVQHCPEELTLQIGTKKDQIAPELIRECMKEYLTWIQTMVDENGCGPVVLFAGIAKNPPYQMLVRRVWIYQEDSGIKKISQTKVLKTMGFIAEAGMEDTRYQNAKMEFDQVCRKTMEEICISHGLQVETIPIVRTLRQAIAWRSVVSKEAEQARAYFQKLVEREDAVTAEELKSDVVQIENDEVAMPELTYRMYVLKESLGELYQTQVEALGAELVRMKDTEHEALNDMRETESRLTTAEMEYAALRMGLHLVENGKKEG